MYRTSNLHNARVKVYNTENETNWLLNVNHVTVWSICDHAEDLSITVRATVNGAAFGSLLHNFAALIHKLLIQLRTSLFIYIAMVLHAATFDPTSKCGLRHN